MLRFLTDQRVTSQEVLPNEWSVTQILDHVAGANAGPGEASPFHALIDTGALIMGMKNLEVARYLLDHGLSGIDGVVFLDEEDRKMICTRKGFRVMKLSQSGVPLSSQMSTRH